VLNETGVEINPEALFDVQVKRIHEYKRQLLNALYIVHRYLELKAMSAESRKLVVKRVFLIGGKAASSYLAAKKIIKLITSIEAVINNDSDIGDLLKVVFLPNYGVTAAQIIIPAADLSQHISTAGSEASGTSNMKFVMNGSVILGTLDGANIEIRNEIGRENIFIFGARAEEVTELRARMREQRGYPIGTPLLTVFDTIRQGKFGSQKELSSLIDALQNGNDDYLVCHDFYPYVEAQAKVDKTYLDQAQWRKMVITGAVSMGYFSSDRAVIEYATDIWGLNSVTIPTPAESALTRVRSQPHLGDRPRDVHSEEFDTTTLVRDVSIEELAHTLSGGESLLHARTS
jgi:starch phosphorylase